MTAMDSATRTLSENDFAANVTDRYFEDYVTGAVYEYGYATVTEAEIIAFAERSTPSRSTWTPSSLAAAPSAA